MLLYVNRFLIAKAFDFTAVKREATKQRERKKKKEPHEHSTFGNAQNVEENCR